MAKSHEPAIERLRKQEDDQRVRAEAARRDAGRLVQQAEETRLAKAQIRLKADATRSALDVVRRTMDAARKAGE